MVCYINLFSTFKVVYVVTLLLCQFTIWMAWVSRAMVVMTMTMMMVVVLLTASQSTRNVVSIWPQHYSNSSGHYRHTNIRHTYTCTYIHPQYTLINKSAGATWNATDDRCLIWNWRKSYPLIAIKYEYRMLHSWEPIASTKYVLLLFRFVLLVAVAVCWWTVLFYYSFYSYTGSHCRSSKFKQGRLFSRHSFHSICTLDCALLFKHTHLLTSIKIHTISQIPNISKWNWEVDISTYTDIEEVRR